MSSTERSRTSRPADEIEAVGRDDRALDAHEQPGSAIRARLGARDF
jgi:hypothetical protein